MIYPYLRTSLAIILGLTPLLSNACNVATGVEEAHGSDQYQLSSSSLSVIDLDSGLMWQRCAVGQSFSAASNSCEGSATTYSDWYSALNALATLNSNNYDGYSNWRIPNVKELWSVVETGCASPAINITSFPNSPTGHFYSSTPTRTTDAEGNGITAGQGLKVPFSFGSSSSLTYLRLVRTYN